MRIKVGSQYQLVSQDIAEGLPGNPPRVVVYELLEYHGQLIVYGGKFSHQQHVYIHGFESIPDRPSCFVVLPDEIVQNVDALVKALDGRPMMIQEGLTQLAIVNWSPRIGTLWHIEDVSKASKDDLVSQAVKVVDLYLEWKRDGHFPGWFISGRRAPKIPQLISVN